MVWDLFINFYKINICDWIDELQSQLKDSKEVNIYISLVRHAFVSNLLPKNFKLKFYVIAKNLLMTSPINIPSIGNALVNFKPHNYV